MVKTGLKLTENEVQGLVRQTIEGNEKAFDSLVTYYRPYIISIIQKKIADWENVEDVCQVVCAKVYQNLHKYTNVDENGKQRKFSSWLARVTGNEAEDARRRMLREESVVSLSEGYDVQDGSIFSSPEKNMINAQTREVVEKAIACLPEKYRRAAELRFLNEYAYEEVAQELQIPLNTARTHIRRASEKLIEMIIADGNNN